MSIYLIQDVYVDYEQGYTRHRIDLTSYGYFDNKELAQRKADQLNIEFYNDLNYSGNRKDETFNKFKKRKKKQGEIVHINDFIDRRYDEYYTVRELKRNDD